MKSVNLFVLLILLFSFSFSNAEKIGYIDSQKIIDGYKGISLLKQQFSKQVTEWEKEAQDKKLEIDSLKKEIEAQKLMLSDEGKKKKENEIREKEKTYEEFLKNIWGEGGKCEQKHEELIKPVIEEVSNILDKIGEEEKYTMIFNISKGDIVYAKAGLDLTERVLYEINKEFAFVTPKTEETKFYVFPFEDKGTEAESKALGQQISAFIKSGLDKFPNFEPIESQKVSEVMTLLGFVKEQELGDNQVKLVSRRIEANIVVFGTIEVSSGRITLKLKWINFDRGADVISKDFTIDEREKLEKLAEDVMTYLGREIKQE